MIERSPWANMFMASAHWGFVSSSIGFIALSHLIGCRFIYSFLWCGSWFVGASEFTLPFIGPFAVSLIGCFVFVVSLIGCGPWTQGLLEPIGFSVPPAHWGLTCHCLDCLVPRPFDFVLSHASQMLQSHSFVLGNCVSVIELFAVSFTAFVAASFIGFVAVSNE